MTERTHDRDDRSVASRLRRLLRRGWGDVMSIYWANTPAWRLLKSGALVFFGFFCWAGGSLLLSYQSEWTWLTYVMAYGFVVIAWGPLTHLVLVPLTIRLRRTARRPIARRFARNASKVNISVFLAIVLVLGTAPIAPMLLDFQGAIAAGGAADVDPEIDCAASDGEITCHVETVDAIDHVVVLSGDRELARDDGPPYELSFRTDETEEVVGQRQFAVEVRDAQDRTLRRYVRTVPDVRE